MKLRFLGKDPDSAGGDSPTLYASDRDTYVIQGWKVTDPDVLAELYAPDGEGCVEVPPELFSHLAKDGIQGTIVNRVSPVAHVTVNGTYIIQGTRVADDETRAQMSIPDHEDCVEVTKAAVHALLTEDDLGIDHERTAR